MVVPYHEDMHSAIWSWIRGWCEEDFYRAPLVLPSSPADVLEWLIWKIGNCGGDTEDSEHPFVVDGGEEDWRGGNMFKFAEKMCEVGQRLFDEGLQEKMSWKNMKMILEYYLDDCTGYIDTINAQGWTHYDINEFLQLGIDWDNVVMSENRMRNRIIWGRYLTSERICLWELGWAPNTPTVWCQWVSEEKNLWNMYTGPLDADVPFTLGDSDLEDTDIEDEEEVETIELTEQQKKKNDALRKIQETLDEVQEDLGDGLYLQLMDLMKTQYVVSS